MQKFENKIEFNAIDELKNILNIYKKYKFLYLFLGLLLTHKLLNIYLYYAIPRHFTTLIDSTFIIINGFLFIKIIFYLYENAIIRESDISMSQKLKYSLINLLYFFCFTCLYLAIMAVLIMLFEGIGNFLTNSEFIKNESLILFGKNYVVSIKDSLEHVFLFIYIIITFIALSAILVLNYRSLSIKAVSGLIRYKLIFFIVLILIPVYGLEFLEDILKHYANNKLGTKIFSFLFGTAELILFPVVITFLSQLIYKYKYLEKIIEADIEMKKALLEQKKLLEEEWEFSKNEYFPQADFLIGTWELMSYTQKSIENNKIIFPWGKKSGGFLSFNKDNFMFEEVMDSSQMRDNISIKNHYNSYCGKYTIQDNTLFIDIKTAFDSNLPGKSVKRFIKIKDNILYIKTEPFNKNGTIFENLYKWDKV